MCFYVSGLHHIFSTFEYMEIITRKLKQEEIKIVKISQK